jgi:drug/metabolite transporter (DMT)-like permease
LAAALLYAFLCIVWGSTWLAIRVGLADLSPFWSLAIRIWPAFLFVTAWALSRRTNWSALREGGRSTLYVGLLVYPAGYGLVYWGEQYVQSGLSAVVFSCMPFFVAIFSWFMLPDERPGPTAIWGLCLGFAGLVTVYWDQLSLGDTMKVLGMAAISLSAIVSSYTTVIIRRDLGKIPPVALTAFTLLVGAIVIPLYALGLEGHGHLHFTPRAVASVAFLSIVASGLAFVVYYHLLSRISALTMSLVSFVTPIVALSLGALFDYTPFGWRARVGIALVLLGVLVATRKGRRGAKPDLVLE